MARTIICVMVLVEVCTWLVTENTAMRSQRRDPQQASDRLAEAARLDVEVVRLYRERKFDEGILLAKRVLEIRETSLHPQHAALASAVTNLAQLYVAKKKYREAERLMERAIEINDSALKPTDATVIAGLQN